MVLEGWSVLVRLYKIINKRIRISNKEKDNVSTKNVSVHAFFMRTLQHKYMDQSNDLSNDCKMSAVGQTFPYEQCKQWNVLQQTEAYHAK